MKKIAKLSFVAAVAVAGFTSANATALEEAIKGVETSGSVVYRYNDYNNDVGAGSSTTTNYYKVALNLASKVNDDVKFNSRFLASDADGGFAALNTQSAGDENVSVTLSNAYFGYTGIQNTTVNVGKQGLTTPWTVAVDASGNEQTGTGILAMSNLGPVTLAAAYFNQHNTDNSGNYATTTTPAFQLTDGSEDIATVGAIATLGPVTFDAWYISVQDTLDSYTIGANSKFEVSGIKLGADARYTGLSFDKNNLAGLSENDDQGLGKITLTADAGLIDAKLAYAKTNKDGGIVALDTDAVTSIQGWSVNANGKADADYWQAVVGVDLLSNLNLSANYVNVDYSTSATTDVEEEEIYAQLVYKMSKNLSTYVRYGTYTKETTTGSVTTDNNDDVRGRLQVAYTF
jgi:hypothetical protein